MQGQDGLSDLTDSEPIRSADDERFMALALTLGRRGLGRTWPNPSVGAVVVRDGVIVGRGWTQPGGRPHAEAVAIARAADAARAATLYVTLEPCCHHGKTPPCTDTVLGAGIARVVSALVDPNPEVAGAGHWRLAEAGVVVEVGIGAEEARRTHAGHIRRMQDGRPNVTLKLAVSADGKAGLAGRKPVRITGAAATTRVHLMRARNDAVLTGIGTALADDPLLTCRLPGMHSPVRVVLDGMLRLPLASRLVSTAGAPPVWVVAGEGAPREREQALAGRGVEVLRVASVGGRLDLAAVLKRLAARGITRLMVEAGPILAAALVRADLVDEAVLLRSPDRDRSGWHRCPRSAAAFRIDWIITTEGGRQRNDRRRHGRDARADLSMFTGIVTDIGEVVAVVPRAAGLARIRIACGYDCDAIAIGASIACSGVCLTVVERGKDGDRGWFAVDAAAETLRVTTVGNWRSGSRINLERALRIGDELGGHLVAGHADGVAALTMREDLTEMARLTFRVPGELARFIAPKGSVAVDGVSLTVNEAAGAAFSVLIIPHTLAVTTLGTLASGDAANLEVDLMARYAARLMKPA